MMWAIFRRKVASVGSNALINNGSVQTLGRARPVLAGSTPQGFVETISTHKALNLGMGSKPLRQFHEGAPGHSLPVRNVVPSLKPNFTTQMWSRSFSSDSGDLVDAVVPFMGESITDGTLATFLKKPGDRVEIDEPIAQIETDKVTIDVASPEAGFIQEFVAKEGDTVEPGTKVAIISKSGGEGATTHVAPSESPTTAAPAPKPAPAAVEKPLPKPDAQPPKDAPKASSPPPSKTSASEPQLPPKDRERRVPMTRLRKRVATRLKDSQNTFALLTTFNEVDMTNLMKLRSEYKEAFLEKHGVKLGLMSGFVKAAVSGLQNQPIINAVIDGDDIIYRDYIDISIAVGTPKGLVVPVIRNAETMNFAEIEKTINTLAKKATNGSISIDEMAGGSFTISNGGVYGSLLSTPIINPPQSAILGMHSIVNKPMVVGGEIVSRPMMYIALTYDHRLIDGREAVFFLRRIKDVVEDPRRLLLDI
ncbi:dihydrolipoyllysine-residue succinyltransferase component of 2-oxoglutarate dehydrogenase complex 2, mitochondrial-like [Cynara cardunculus var. scolymus]|uniref:dihydrolipoyllysine-residue succinyltransferase component of 2-oxoglutarate dehydrogenase complex 2, mitochondrial-like n=1 Tax=Cynara cardunculus var. scolymus TaxID=59895 RepID=UPI000D630583|nr:dihydrolipoyllysine-residue succinyltransferase component of 2-oxoglutarate dehydrogenase complex 2, mitochondrial-like [Cynara cardunculus var. scolymus]XP_024986277.1 dihydrolipoyllysine-residue succinyltransferase component of 2-oxoglutarate dehydrogenase complex 2, mitochondrial-like [Cynara cardunculus var. scolymus]